MRIRCAISPDADDRFMFRAITEGLIDTRGLEFSVEARDTHQLNQMADGQGPDVTAISIAHYPRVAAHYQLLAHGGSVGRGYGPVLIARPGTSLAELPGRRVAVPGLTTTAALVLRMILPFEPVTIPIFPTSLQFDALRTARVDAALIIHEGRLTYADHGFVRLLDIGEWWQAETGLPLPLGGNVIRRDLGAETIATADAVLRASIAHGLAHREDAITWLLGQGGALESRAAVDHYLSLYANADTLDYGSDGRAGIRELLRRGAEGGWIPAVERVDLVGG